jgi:hypothetical protein
MAAGDLEYRVRLDLQGFPSLSGPRPLRLVSNQKVTLNLVVEQLTANTVPPGYTPINVTSWVSRWIAKLDVDDADASVKWNVAGSVVDGPNGKLQVVIPKTSVNFTIDHGYSEIVLYPDASNPQMRLILPYVLTPQGLSL